MTEITDKYIELLDSKYKDIDIKKDGKSRYLLLEDTFKLLHSYYDEWQTMIDASIKQCEAVSKVTKNE